MSATDSAHQSRSGLVRWLRALDHPPRTDLDSLGVTLHGDPVMPPQPQPPPVAPSRSVSRATARGGEEVPTVGRASPVGRPLVGSTSSSLDKSAPGVTSSAGGIGAGGVLGNWLNDLLRLTQPSSAGGGGGQRMRGASPLGCALPPLTDPFWRRADLASQVRTVLGTLQRERALLVAQLRAHRGALQTRAHLEATAAAQDPARGVDAAALQKALDSQAALAREREAKLQAEIDSVMLAGVEALEAKNLSSLEAERLTKQVRRPSARHQTQRRGARSAGRAGQRFSGCCARANWPAPRLTCRLSPAPAPQVESLEVRLEEERAAHRQALADLGSELSAAQELSQASADNNAAAAALSAEVTRLQASLGRAQSRLQAAEDRAQVARATSTSAQLDRDSCQRELADLRSQLARLETERREEAEAARDREEALLREVEALRSAGPYAGAGEPWLGAEAGLDLPDHVVRILAAKEAEVVAAVQETELMAEALTALHDALDEATGQLRAHKQLTADAQRALGEAAAALEAAAGRERELLGQVSATEDGAREVISRLRGECEALLLGAGAVDDGGSEWERGESRLSMRSGSSGQNPYEARSRNAVHAANKASFLKVKAERDALKQELAAR